MKTRALETTIYLQPGLLSIEVMRELLSRCFRAFHWFLPARYGFASLKKRLDPNRPDIDAIVTYYEEWKAACVAAKTDRDFLWIHPAAPDYPPYVGNVSWTTRRPSAVDLGWRRAHASQVAELMKLVSSPLAIAALTEDVERKRRKLIPHGLGLQEVSTVRDYSEGLAGLFWRNFYGPPFVRLFGERLTSLPAESQRDLGNGVVLVQPYELPGEADTEQGKARERTLIQHLGPECFYDHARHLKPTRLPDLSSLASQT